MSHKVFGLDIIIKHKGGLQDNRYTHHSQIFAHRDVTGHVVACFLSHRRFYDETYNYPNDLTENCITQTFETSEEFIQKAVSIAKKSDFKHVEVEVIGCRDGVRFDQEFKIDIDKSDAMFSKYNNMERLLGCVFESKASLEQFLNPLSRQGSVVSLVSEQIDIEPSSAEVKIQQDTIEKLQQKLAHEQQLRLAKEETISVYSTATKKKKKKRGFRLF